MPIKVYGVEAEEPIEGEEWRQLSGGLEVSSEGRARLTVTIPLKPKKRKDGYLSLSFGNKDFLLHCLVAEAFLGKKPIGMQVNHKDCNRGNSKLSNLEYVTPSENSHHAARMGRGPAKLSEYQVEQIRAQYGTGESVGSIAREFGLHEDSVRRIVHRQSWKDVD